MALPRRLRNRWWIVFASAVGLTVGTGSILAINFAVFVKPVTEELGWSRGALSAALLVIGLAIGAGIGPVPLIGYVYAKGTRTAASMAEAHA